MRWPTLSLSQAADINPRDRDWQDWNDDTTVSFVPMASVSESTASIVDRQTRQLAEVRKGYTPFRDGDVLIAKITPCMENGKVALAEGLVNGLGFGSTEFHVLRPRPGIEAPYLYHFVRQETFRRAAKARMRGGVGQQRVPEEFVREYPMPVPSPSEQRRIVEILDQADRLRRLRAEADAKAERILPALFIKIFGDSGTNWKGWPIKPLGTVGELDRGRSKHRPRNDPALLGGPYPLIQTGDVANSGGRIRRYTQTYSELGLAQSKIWPVGTLCITIAANIAKTGVLEFDACFPDSIVGFSPGVCVTTEYIQFLLSNMQVVLERKASQAAQKNINLEVLRSISAPVPPITLQRRFSDQVTLHYQNQSRQWAVREKLDRLFASAVRRAFSGELTASWREAHMKDLLQEMEQQAKTIAEARR